MLKAQLLLVAAQSERNAGLRKRRAEESLAAFDETVRRNKNLAREVQEGLTKAAELAAAG